MRITREGLEFNDGDVFLWPFPRLRFLLRHGYWCSHEWGGWMMIDLGRRKMRRCGLCSHAELL